MQGKTVKDLLYDFAMKFKKGDVDGVDEYFKRLFDANNMKLLTDALLKRS